MKNFRSCPHVNCTLGLYQNTGWMSRIKIKNQRRKRCNPFLKKEIASHISRLTAAIGKYVFLSRKVKICLNSLAEGDASFLRFGFWFFNYSFVTTHSRSSSSNIVGRSPASAHCELTPPWPEPGAKALRSSGPAGRWPRQYPSRHTSDNVNFQEYSSCTIINVQYVIPTEGIQHRVLRPEVEESIF